MVNKLAWYLFVAILGGIMTEKEQKVNKKIDQKISTYRNYLKF